MLFPFIFSEELEGGLKAFIGAKDEEIALSKLIVVPHYLRFDQVTLAYRIGSQSIAKKCESFRGYLSAIKATLYDSSVIHFDCEINHYNPTQFQNHPTLLEHIRCIVSICDSSRGYSFDIHSIQNADSSTFGNKIVSILEMPAIARSSTVRVTGWNSGSIKLPVETISNWLNRERHAMNQNQQERYLFLVFDSDLIANIQEMYDLLEQVSYFSEYLFF